MHSAGGRQTSLWRSCLIRSLRAHRSHAAPPERFAGLRVRLRPSAPRHPPRPLLRLFFSFLALGSIEVIMLFNCEGTPVMSLDNWKVENSEQCFY
jgi:hypothetical protein